MNKHEIIKTYMFIQKQGNPLKSYFTNFLKSVEKAKLVKVIKTKHI